MRKIGHSGWRFFSSNIFSRALLPFSLLLLSNLKEMLMLNPQGFSVQGWISVSLSLAFFYTLYTRVLKRETARFSRGDLWMMGLIWVGIAIVAHMIMLYGLRHLDLFSIFPFYSVYPLTLWTFSLGGLLFIPRLAAIVAKKWFF